MVLAKRFARNAALTAWCLASALIASAAAAEIETQDGLSLEINDRGVVTGVALDGRSLGDGKTEGGFYVFDAAAAPRSDKELAHNPSFEQIVDGKPVGWQAGEDWSVDHTVAHSGNASMRVSIPGDKKRTSGHLEIELAVKPNTPYRVSMWMRTQGSAPHFYIVQMDAQGKTRPGYPQLTTSHSRRNSDWFELSRSVTTAAFCRKMWVYTSLWRQTGTAWIDDVSVKCLAADFVSHQQLVAVGALTKTDNGAEQSATMAAMRLKLNAKYQATANYIAISGQVVDTSGSDRAVCVSFRLPIDAAGWTWFDDIHTQQRIAPGTRYGAARLLGEHRQIALYPFAAMGDGRSALALAVPMDMPRVFRLCYEQGLGYFVNYEFGLAPDAKKHPSQADFKFYVYRIDPEWGLRSAAARYYEFFPQFFVKRLQRQGAAGFMPTKEQVESPDFIVPDFAIYSWQKRQSMPILRRELTKVFSYTEFAGWWGWAVGITPEMAKTKPTYEQAWQHIEQLAKAKPPKNKVALCILNSAPFDRDGKRRLHRSYVPQWGGYNYLCNPDPEITGIGGKVNRYTLTYEREVSKVDTFKLDGVYYDCVFVFQTDNFRREHFKWADHPLAFDHQTCKPCIPMAFSIYECAKAIADHMHGRGKWVMANYSVTHEPTDMFCIQFIDVIGNEMLWTWTTDAKFALQRTLAHQKIVTMSWQEAKNKWPAKRLEPLVKQAMAYGTFFYLSGLPKAMDQRWRPLTKRIAAAGWEPVTYARTTDPNVFVERFGSIADHSLHFTLRNTANATKRTKLAINTQALGIKDSQVPTIWYLVDSASHKPARFVKKPGAWNLELQIPANDTVVLRVGSLEQLAADYLMEAPDWIERADNYAKALQKARIKLETPDYAAVSEKVERVRNGLLSGKLDAKEAAQALDGLEPKLAKHIAQPKSADTQATIRRYGQCLDRATHAIQTASRTLEQQ